jgi:hypothetical protein
MALTREGVMGLRVFDNEIMRNSGVQDLFNQGGAWQAI